MATRVKSTGMREWRAALDAIAKAVNLATERSTTQAAHIVERRVKLTLRTYTHPPGTPTPSPAGAPPALVTGSLMRSIYSTPTWRVRAGVYRSKVGPTIVYARAQELGYPPRGLPKRPYQKPATRAELVRIHLIYRDNWAEALRV